jgi:3-hydroxymyristoyl/3-hydroxydecanoyl-(acyl carrier protein) dehydratase
LPPAAIVAEGLARLINEMQLFSDEILQAGGVVHTSQEAEFRSAVMPGEKVTATARLAGNSVRRGSRFVSVFTELRNASNEIVATASSTIVVPV